MSVPKSEFSLSGNYRETIGNQRCDRETIGNLADVAANWVCGQKLLASLL